MIAEAGGRVWVKDEAECSPDPDEARWIANAKLGDEAACGRLLDRYRERAIRLASHILGRPAEAEDVAQEAFVRAFRGIRSYRGDCRFYTWLYPIVVRVCIERQRRSWWKRESSLEPDWDAPALEGSSGQLDARLLVEALMSRLSPPIRATLVLRELEGLDYEEIAAVLVIPVGTVRSRLNAARAQFRRLYEAAVRETESV